MTKMRQPQQSRRWFMGLFVLAIAGLLTACSSPGGEGCGGIDDIVSCISISSIQPVSTAGEDSPDVDVTFNTDCDGDPTTIDPELFGSHDARVTFANAAFPNFIGDDEEEPGSLDVTIERVRITYQVNNCPPLAGCPPLPELNQAVSLTIPAATEDVVGIFPLVPISTKQEFLALGGSANAFPSYTANYTFTGRTQSFSDTITIRGATNFVMGSFNVCGQ
jgi:hypothetical protein